MRTVGLIFYEETDTAPALAAGAEAAAAEAEARGAGKEDPAPAQEKAPEDMTVTELRSFAAAHGIDVTGAAKKPGFTAGRADGAGDRRAGGRGSTGGVTVTQEGMRMVADKEFYYGTYHGQAAGRQRWRDAWPARSMCCTA